MRITRAGVASRRDQWVIAGVTALLGILVVGQLRGQEGVPGLSGMSAQEMGVLIANLSDHNDALRNEIATLERQEADVAAARNRGDSALEQLRADLARIKAWSGLTSLSGSGVVITVRGSIGGDGVEDLINELRNAGAEAIAVDGVRLVPGVVVAGPPGGLSIENSALADVFEIRAIGSPQIMTGTLTRGGGIIALLGTTYRDAQISVTPSDDVVLPATTRTLVPISGRPTL
jgi:uncharacterized protein YlxW (UPF0749 family)